MRQEGYSCPHRIGDASRYGFWQRYFITTTASAVEVKYYSPSCVVHCQYAQLELSVVSKIEMEEPNEMSAVKGEV